MSRYVGIDLHRRRSVVVILDADGVKVSSTRIKNSPMNLAAAVREAGPEPEVVLEATTLGIGLFSSCRGWVGLCGGVRR